MGDISEAHNAETELARSCIATLLEVLFNAERARVMD